MEPEHGKKINYSTSLACCGAIILAGGLSSRFGSPKAEALWNGRTMIENVVDSLGGQLSTQPVIVCREEQSSGLQGLGTLTHDNCRYTAGPLRGIVAGLAACGTRYAFVLSCDSPCIQPELLLALANRAGSMGENVAVVPRWQGRDQVLTALYSCSAGPLLEQALAAGESSPNRALKGLGFVTLTEEECLAADKHGLSFININTTHDLEMLHKYQNSNSNSDPVRL
jgi:molybdenum cofactor guanylyltransferase